MSGAKIKQIKAECQRFADIRNLPADQLKTLIHWAIKSYLNTPAHKKAQWSLKDI